MSKKWMMAMLAACVCMQSVAIMAMEDKAVSPTTSVVAQSNIDGEAFEVANEEQGMYMTKTGEITEINTENDTYELLVGSMTDGIRVRVQDGTQILNVETLAMLKVEDLKVGMNVTVLIDKNVPMTMSLPPICSVDSVILVNSLNKQVEVAYFNEALINEANTLMLKQSDQTMIQNITGERRVFTFDDVKNKEAIVIYTNSTRSIPAQTIPEFIWILSQDTPLATETVEEKNTKAVENKAEYIALREIEKEYGYSIQWNHETKTATLSQNKEEFSFTVGKKSYQHNGENVVIEKEIKIINGALCVPSEMIEVLG